MQSDLLQSLRRLTDSELVARVRDLVAREREVTVLLVAHLAELDTRDVHYRAGHASLFAYCREALGLSEQEAYNRIAVTRAVRRFPVILEWLQGGALNLTSVRLLAPHLTAENHRGVLESARGRSKAQVEEIAAALWPRPDAPSLVRKLPARTAMPPSLPAGAPPVPHVCALGSPAPATASPPSDHSPARDPALRPNGPHEPESEPQHDSGGCVGSGLDAAVPWGSAPAPAPARRAGEVTPLSPDRYRVQVTIGAETLAKLRLAKDLLRHAVPSGDEAVIFDRALTALLEDLGQKKLAAAQAPRPAPGTAPGSRHVPAEVRRAVWLRDQGRCAFVGSSGRRCSERALLEFHHLRPHAHGGQATIANIQLRCRSHNAYEARLYFGHGHGNGDGGAAAVSETRTRSRTSAPPPALPGSR